MSEPNRQCGNQPDAVDKTQTQSKFTPGPWIINPIRPGDKEIYINQPGDSWERLEATVSRDDCDSDMALANAHLIAAAPEMYEALKNMSALLREGLRGEFTDELKAKLGYAYERSFNALTKAEGSAK